MGLLSLSWAPPGVPGTAPLVHQGTYQWLVFFTVKTKLFFQILRLVMHPVEQASWLPLEQHQALAPSWVCSISWARPGSFQPRGVLGGPPEPLSTSLCSQPSGCFHSSKCGVGMKSPWGSRGLSLRFPLTVQGPEASQQETSASSAGTRVCSAWAGVCPAGELQELNDKCWYE